MRSIPDLYGGSMWSKGFGLLSFLAGLLTLVYVFALEWGSALISVVFSIAFGYVSYRLAGGSRNPALNRYVGITNPVSATGGVFDQRSASALTLLTQAAFQGGLIGHICDTYVKSCRDSLRGFGIEPRKLSEDDEKRLAFEVLAYGAFLIMSLAPQVPQGSENAR